MIEYSDLMTVPYKQFGRDKDGMDCYGLVIELCKRNGTPLRDIVYDSIRKPESFADESAAKINVERMDSPEEGGLISCTFQNELHIGFLIDRRTVLHQTMQGVRITPLMAFKNLKFYKVVEYGDNQHLQ